MAIGLKLSKLILIDCTLAVKIFQDKKNNVAFIDVRDRKKYVQGFAFGAVNCPMDRFNSIISDLVPNKSTHLIIIGASTSIIKKISAILNRYQFKNYCFIKGNYLAWKKARLPMWAGEFTFSKAFGEWIEISGNIKNIYPKQLKQLHSQNMQSVTQIDARPKIEYQNFTLPFSQQCSGGELPALLNNKQYDKKKVIVHCAGRTRSIIAYQTLLDFNFSHKKYVLNGGTQNWVLHGYERAYQKKSSIQKTKINLKQDIKLAKQIQKKYQLPFVFQAKQVNQSHAFIIQSEIQPNKNNAIWKSVNATTLVQSTDKFIASTNTPIYVFSNIPTSAVFTVLWLRRLGYQAIWHQQAPKKNLTKKFCSKDFNDPTYFFPHRHKGSNEDAKGYLNWEHQLIPSIQKWGCSKPWHSINYKNLKMIIHPIVKIYKKI
jgi:rhodanese-related sulfurtransferase